MFIRLSQFAFNETEMYDNGAENVRRPEPLPSGGKGLRFRFLGLSVPQTDPIDLRSWLNNPKAYHVMGLAWGPRAYGRIDRRLNEPPYGGVAGDRSRSHRLPGTRLRSDAVRCRGPAPLSSLTGARKKLNKNFAASLTSSSKMQDNVSRSRNKQKAGNCLLKKKMK
jgi:hypothetical protein